MAGANATDKEKRAFDEVQQRIAALKLRTAPAQPSPKRFRYDPDEPHRLSTKTGK
jgi:hypothetical protein